MSPARRIVDVLGQLDVIIAHSRARGTADGYFAVLCRQVTAEVARRIADGYFEDPTRMERLAVMFANRYFAAASVHESGGAGGVSWGLAFAQSRAYWPLVIQHLLIGMNAHINLDLGIAAAEIAPGNRIHALETDFARINHVLAELVDEVQVRLAAIWPALRRIYGFAGRADQAVTNFSMARAREHAWMVATRLAAIDDPAERSRAIAEIDVTASAIGALVLRPPSLSVRLGLKVLRLQERGTVADKIAVLEG